MVSTMNATGPRGPDLLAIMRKARELLATRGDDTGWSSWPDQAHALGELDQLIGQLEQGEVAEAKLRVLFAPTGNLQDVSLQNGWSDEYLELAKQFDVAVR